MLARRAGRRSLLKCLRPDHPRVRPRAAAAVQDHVREKPENKHLKSLTLKEFTGLIFQVCPGLEPFKKSLEQIYQNFNAYKRTVPVRGAILLDPSMQKCLMVKGWKKDAGWGFPRGKLSKNETDAACAIREVGGEEAPGLAWLGGAVGSLLGVSRLPPDGNQPGAAVHDA